MFIARFNDMLAVEAFASVTVVVKPNVPVCDVVPEISPVAVSRDKPFGSAPAVSCQRYGALPPVADRVVLYAVPTVPLGKLCAAIPSLTGGVTVTSALATVVPAAKLVAVIVTFVDEPTLGAVYRPLLVIVPVVAFHTTFVKWVEVSVAVNCCFAPEKIVTLTGETFILTGGLLGPAD